jgi:hypothetical protein
VPFLPCCTCPRNKTDYEVSSSHNTKTQIDFFHCLIIFHFIRANTHTHTHHFGCNCSLPQEKYISVPYKFCTYFFYTCVQLDHDLSGRNMQFKIKLIIIIIIIIITIINLFCFDRIYLILIIYKILTFEILSPFSPIQQASYF